MQKLRRLENHIELKKGDFKQEYAGKMKFRPAIVEKDYYLTMILNKIEKLLTEGFLKYKGESNE